MILRSLLATTLLFNATGALAEATHYPVTIKSCNRDVTFQEAPKHAVSHDINMIRTRVDRLVLLKTRLYAAGPPADVLKAEILREVYGKDLVITEKDLIIVEDYHHHHH